MSEAEAEAAPDEADGEDGPKEVEGTRVAEETAPFEAFIEAAVLEDFLAPLDAVADEIRLQLTEDGFFANVVDPANVGIAAVELDKDAFETYHLGGEGMVGLNIGRLLDILDFADSGDLVSLALNAETKELDIEFATTSMTMATIDPDQVRREGDIAKLDLAVDVTLTGAQFSRAVDLVDMVSDHLIVVGDPGESRWVVRGEGDIDTVEESFSKDDLIRGQVPDDHETYLSVEYMVEMVGPIPKAAEVRLRHGTEFPVTWEYHIGDAVSVKNLLSPRFVKR